MASTTEIVNAALTLLGQGGILSIDDNVKPAREAKKIFDITLRALLAGYSWSFAKARVKLPALADAPAFEYAYAYQLPSDCLRVVQVAEHYVGVDLSDYRSYSAKEFAIEGGQILTDIGADLPIKYIKYISDPAKFSPNFTETLSCRLAERLAEPLTQSDSKRQRAIDAFNGAIRMAVRANAIELPADKLPDDEWVMSRL